MAKLILIRHTSVNVAPGTCYGHLDVPLADSFEHEANDVLVRLNNILRESTPIAVYCSPSSRCTKLCLKLGYSVFIEDTRLMELNFGDWEGQRYDDIKDSNLQKYYDDYIHQRATNGESLIDQLNRVKSFLDEMKNTYKQKKNRHILVFTHGGVLMCMEALSNRYLLEDGFKHKIPYGGIIVIDL